MRSRRNGRRRPPRAFLPAALGLSLGLLACGGGGDGSPMEPPPPPPPIGPNELPTAAFTLDSDAGFAPFTVQANASASSDPDGSIVSYQWSFGDGATGSGVQVSHPFAAVGSYVITLTVRDDRGGEDSLSDTVYVSTGPGGGANTIEGTVWFDRDLDGTRDGDEPGLARFRVFLDEDGDGELDAGEPLAFTDGSGGYRFQGLEAGRPYRVTQALPFGWSNTTPGLPGAAPTTTGPERIYGGEDAGEGEFPFQVALLSPTGFQFCGGTQITSEWVLTAAHCVEGAQESDVEVLLGVTNLLNQGEIVPVRTIRYHPQFNVGVPLDYDVAVLRLERSVMRPRAFLHTPGEPGRVTPGTIATTIGWGQMEAGADPSQLQKLQTPLLSNEECDNLIQATITERMICSGGVGTGEGPCWGDSGGPLLVPSELGWMQVGITSFHGRQCGGLPAGYARVSALLDYIQTLVPVERSGGVEVEWGGGPTARVDFGNFH